MSFRLLASFQPMAFVARKSASLNGFASPAGFHGRGNAAELQGQR